MVKPEPGLVRRHSSKGQPEEGGVPQVRVRLGRRAVRLVVTHTSLRAAFSPRWVLSPASLSVSSTKDCKGQTHHSAKATAEPQSEADKFGELLPEGREGRLRACRDDQRDSRQVRMD